MIKQHLEPQAFRDFARAVVIWQKQHGRHQLPWQKSHDPYPIWVAEIMLQQTQVKTVLNYYPRFLDRFPNVEALAHTPLDDLMPYWAGLGYYARARNLHRTARIIVTQHGGQFPRTQAELKELPGIGPSTAAAIAAFAFAERISILDGNVKRVLARFAGIDAPIQSSATERQMWDLAQELLHHAPQDLDMAAYTQGLMDLGALVCTRSAPACAQCPLRQHCHAYCHDLQDQLPVPRTTRPLPTREKHMLVWQQGNHILLERRKKQGIWGGLLSLPEFKARSHLEEFYRSQGCFAKAQALEPASHRFTHFILHIRPWLIHHREATLPPMDNKNHLWIPTEALAHSALPAPIRRLLLSPVVSAIAELADPDGD